MEPFYEISEASAVESLRDGMGLTVVEGRVLTDECMWSDSALESVAADLHGQSIVAAGDIAQMSVYDVSGSVAESSVESGAVEWSASVRAELAKAIQKHGLDVVVRGRRSFERDDSGQRVVADAEVGRLLVGAVGESLALDTAATQASSMDSAPSEVSAAALADVDGSLDSNEREVLRERERLSSH